MKKNRIDNIDDKWVSASMIHNFMLNDPLIDYLKLTTTDVKDNFFNLLCEFGNKFESVVVNELFPNSKRICYNQEDILKIDKYNDTINEMNKGTPIIYQGVLKGSGNLYGSPDILIRNDYINLYFPFIKLENNISFFGNYYYVVIDIKLNKLKYNKDRYLLNSGRSIANKAQISIYNKMLSEIQDYNPNISFVIGKKTNGIDIAKIDVNEINLVSKINDGIKWLKKLKNNYQDWIVDFNPNNINNWNTKNYPIELYPNMCNKYDAPYSKIKMEIANKLNEITLISGITYKQRQFLHNKNIYEWNDKKIMKHLTGISYEIIKQQSNSTKKSHNQKRNKIEFFLDFETINSIFNKYEKISDISSKSYVFMIGLLCKNDKNLTYFNFTAKDLSEKEEFRIFDELCKTIIKIESDHNVNNSPIYHWGHIENYIYKEYSDKYNFPKLNLCNLLQIFRQNQITKKGSFTFSLKDLNHKKDSINGLDAMISAYNYYCNNENSIGDIIKYNQEDCTMILKLLDEFE